MKIYVSEAARQDPLRIDHYFAERNPAAADAILKAIDSKFGQLARFPFIGRERTSLGEGLGSAVVGAHLIFYTVDREQITSRG
jgi:plasmid stabilization system protein ParE